MLTSLIVALAVAAEPERAADQSLWSRTQLSGDWWGSRSALATHGITLDMMLTNIGQGVASGGLRREFEVGGNFNLELNADLGTLGLIPGGSVLVHGESRYGETVNADTGALTPVNTRGYFPQTTPSEETVPFAVTELSYSQTLFEIVDITVGKMIVVDGDPLEFAGGRGVTQFLNSNFIYNAATSQTSPYATLGISLSVQATSWLSVSGALYQTTDSSTTSGFENFDNGWTWWGQLSSTYTLGELPGGVNLGGMYAFDNEFTSLNGTIAIVPGGVQLATVSDSWCLFGGAWQYVYAPNPKAATVDPSDDLADLEGLGVFARLGFGDPDANVVDWSLSVGLGGRGLIPGRPNDTYGLAYYLTQAQRSQLISALPFNDSTQGVEAYYDLVVTPAIDLTFDVQVIDGIVRREDPALVLGLRLNVAF
ncbi:MAG: carbohydrate porin [Phycisphaerae bacterium]|nr:carbohydrate porin [Phycisphaerae bacterium]